jgi:signal transduction histidine kinase
MGRLHTLPRVVSSSPQAPARPIRTHAWWSDRIAELERERDELQAQTFHLERLAQAGLMAGGLAHDTRNLLTGISGYCQLALAGEPGGDRLALSRANDLAMQAAEAMKVFVTFVRQAGRAPAPCRVGDVVADALRFLEPVLGKSRVRVVQEVSPDAVARCERTLLLQALVNLVLNAIHAIGNAQGLVEVRAEVVGSVVSVEVADNGPGIPPFVRARLFQPFATGTAAKGGTGLGLFVTQRIVEEQGGTIAVESEEGGGSRFLLTFPAAHEDTNDANGSQPR